MTKELAYSIKEVGSEMPYEDKIFIRERINIVNYENENQGLVYTSSGISIDGGIINVRLESDVAGWHQLSFDVPAFIIKEGKQEENPLLKKIFPLSKLQYTKVVREKGTEKEYILYFIVQPQEGTRDDSGIVLYSFDCIDYPRHALSKSKVGITIGEDTLDDKRSMTPNNEIMDVPGRVIYIKAPVEQREFNTINDLNGWLDAKPGAFAYIKNTKKAYRLTGLDPAKKDESGNLINWFELLPNQSYTMDGETPVPDAVWCPDWEGYPLAPDPNTYDFGELEVNDFKPEIVQFYWDTLWVNPERTIGRFEGEMYQKGSRLISQIYETLNYDYPDTFIKGTFQTVEDLNSIQSSYSEGATAYVISDRTVYIYTGTMWESTYQTKQEAFRTEKILKGKWANLSPMKPYLAPNDAETYLSYILEGTTWTVGEVDEIMVDKSTIAFDEEGNPVKEQELLTTQLFFDNSNAYNAITELTEAFKCYARFDHVNKKVNLRSVPGDDNGLTYLYRDNLTNSKIVQDGEKAVSKLWVYGGEDLGGPVYIQDCNRMNPDYYLADYTSLEDLETRVKDPIVNNYAKVSTIYTWAQLSTNNLDVVEKVEDLPSSGSLGDYCFVTEQNSIWVWYPEGNSWYDTYLELEPYTSDYEIKLEQRYDYNGDSWVSKGQFYHWYEPVSPYADNYILDFRYFLDRNMITEEQVEDIKMNYILPISKLNRKRAPLYKEYQELNQELLDWNNTYDSSKIARDAIRKSLMTSYAIYENTDGIERLVELNVLAFPPGADIGATGWIKSELIYSEHSDFVTVNTFDNLPSGTIGQFVRVKEEAAIYYYSGSYDFDDTICAHLGFTEAEVAAIGPNGKEKELLVKGDFTARVRTEGLFQKLRDRELVTYDELSGWYNPPTNMSELIELVGEVSDTSTSHAYYDNQGRYLTEQITMNDALDRLMDIETQLTLMLDKIERLEASITSINHQLKDDYGDFIVEGTFTDDSIVWIYNLWYAGLEAMDLYHRPLITYELGVTDVSGLPEYRTVTGEIYHDIVYRLNKPELVLPNPGDYCYVTDNKLGIVKEKANITTVVRNLSNPSQHEITIATVDTNTEDLIGKLVTAANTMYSKEHIYNRSAIIKPGGTVAQDSLSESLEDNSGKMVLMSNSGTVILGENGITTVDRNDARKRMQYTGKGIFASENGGITWENIVNAGKISVRALSAGAIDANTISVSNVGQDASVIIDGKGITAMNYGGSDKNASITVDDKTSFFLDAKTGNAFFRGTVQAGRGLIGGWNINSTSLSSRSGNNYTGLSSSGTYAFWAGKESASSAPFYVKQDGTLNATNATIKGAITATSGNIGGCVINGGKLEIANANIDSLEVKKLTSGSNGNAISLTNLTANNIVANNATITGNITATSGSIGGSLVTSGINASNVTAGTLSGRSIRVGSSYGGSLIYRDGTAYLSCGSVSSHPWASALSLSSANGLYFYTGNSYSNIGSYKGHLSLVNDFFCFHNRGLHIEGNLSIKGGEGYAILSQSGKSGFLDVNGVYINQSKGVSYLTSQASGRAYLGLGNAIYLVTGSGGVNNAYCSGANLGQSLIKTDAGSSSSLNTKDINFKLEEKDINEGLQLLKDMNLYDYNYKYNLATDRHQYGFIIDELKEHPLGEKFFRFETQKAKIQGDRLDALEEEDIQEDDTVLEIGKYNPDVLDKYLLLVCKGLLEKVDLLEQELKDIKKEA